VLYILVHAGYHAVGAADNVANDVAISILELSTQHRWTQSSADELFHKLANSILPMVGGRLVEHCPQSFNEAKGLLKAFTVEYTEVHFCPQGCEETIWTKDDAEKHCTSCGAARYYATGKPRSVLRYWPLADSMRLVLAHPVLAQYLRAHTLHVADEKGMAGIWGVFPHKLAIIMANYCCLP